MSELIHCLPCRKKHPVENPERVMMKNGKAAIKGTCPDCGRAIHKIIKQS